MKVILKNKPPKNVCYGVVKSSVGKLLIGLCDKGTVCRLSFLHKQKIADVIEVWQRAWPKTSYTSGAQLEKYEGRPIMMVGTEFQQAVWRVMAKVPSGSVTTYGAIASYIGKPHAARAVGAACGANPVPYLVPCHRVIAADGGLGGFSGGLDMKKILLKSEGYSAARSLRR